MLALSELSEVFFRSSSLSGLYASFSTKFSFKAKCKRIQKARPRASRICPSGANTLGPGAPWNVAPLPQANTPGENIGAPTMQFGTVLICHTLRVGTSGPPTGSLDPPMKQKTIIIHIVSLRVSLVHAIDSAAVFQRSIQNEESCLQVNSQHLPCCYCRTFQSLQFSPPSWSAACSGGVASPGRQRAGRASISPAARQPGA